MDINKLSKLYTKICQKYNFDQIDLNRDNKITEDEIIKIAEYDEEIGAVLNSSSVEFDEKTSFQASGENDILTEDVSPLSGSAVGEVSKKQQGQNLQPKTHVEIKTMEEYSEILDAKFEELYQRFNGNENEINQYIQNNLGDYTDITGDGRTDKLDLVIWHNYYQEKFKNLSSSSKDFQEKGKEYVYARKNISLNILNNVKMANDSTIEYDLKDVEDIMKLQDKKVGYGFSIPGSLNLNIAQVAMEENWEERYDAIFTHDSELYTHSGTQPGTTKYKIKAAEEFIKNNPDKTGYGGLFGIYSSYLKENNVKLLDKYVQYALKQAVDINGDGICDAKDLANFSTNIDLDGDGVISNEEKTFLEKVKSSIHEKVFSYTVRKGYANQNTIDDLISALEIYDEAFIENRKNEAILANTEMYNSDTVDSSLSSYNININGIQYNANWGSGRTGRYAVRLINQYVPYRKIAEQGYLDGTQGIINIAQTLENPNGDYFIDDLAYTNQRLVNMIDYVKPQSTYLHYVNSADLSKEELEEILNKINSASYSVQKQMAEVKKLVEAKLAAMV